MATIRGVLLDQFMQEFRRQQDEFLRSNPDPFETMLREAAVSLVRNERRGRRATFFTGPRGLEGPLSNIILGGGTSILGTGGGAGGGAGAGGGVGGGTGGRELPTERPPRSRDRRPPQ